jgi:hypothetical protein
VGISSWSPTKTPIIFYHMHDRTVGLTLSFDPVKNVDGMKIK